MSNRMLSAAFAAVIGAVSTASAGIITIKGAAPGTYASVEITGSGFSPFSTQQIVPANGQVTFTLAAQYQAGGNKIKKKWVPAGQEPASITVTSHFAAGTLPGLEPFTLPALIPTPLAPPPAEPAVEIDLNALLASGLTFNLNDTFNVTNGAVSGVPQVTIPGFTGTAAVAEFVSFAVLPEPTMLSVLVVCALLPQRRR